MSKLKEQLARSIELNSESIEFAIYSKAAASAVNPKFKEFYQGKADEKEARMKELKGV